MNNANQGTDLPSAPVIPSGKLAAIDGSSAGSERVLAAFQDTMRAFLEVQRTTMLTYLSGRGQPPTKLPARPSGAASAPERVFAVTRPAAGAATTTACSARGGNRLRDGEQASYLRCVWPR